MTRYEPNAYIRCHCHACVTWDLLHPVVRPYTKVWTQGGWFLKHGLGCEILPPDYTTCRCGLQQKLGAL